MEHLEGIIDKERNPFICDSWIEQGYRFTDHRKDQLKDIIGYDQKTIKSLNRNKAAYVAFVAIRWGFAEITDDKLTTTKKWHNRSKYDFYGQPLRKSILENK